MYDSHLPMNSFWDIFNNYIPHNILSEFLKPQRQLSSILLQIQLNFCKCKFLLVLISNFFSS